MTPTVIHPDLGPLKLGRTPPKSGARRVHFGAFVTGADLAPPPIETTYSPLAQPCLDEMLLNNLLSNCTTTTSFHIAGLLLGNAGVGIKFANSQAEAFYARSTGYIPGRPATDQGGNEIDVLDCWREHGLEKGLHGIAGHLSINGANKAQTQTALAKFENLYFGASLPDAWLRARDGDTLDAGGEPNPNNGHAFCGICYDAGGVWCVLWGSIKVRLTWDAVAKFTSPAAGGELHSVISHDAVAKGTARAYSGIDFAAMEAVFASLGGSTTPPARIIA